MVEMRIEVRYVWEQLRFCQCNGIPSRPAKRSEAPSLLPPADHGLPPACRFGQGKPLRPFPRADVRSALHFSCVGVSAPHAGEETLPEECSADRKSTRLNSSH